MLAPSAKLTKPPKRVLAHFDQIWSTFPAIKDISTMVPSQSDEVKYKWNSHIRFQITGCPVKRLMSQQHSDSN
jgi:hypothetical protein